MTTDPGRPPEPPVVCPFCGYRLLPGDTDPEVKHLAYCWACGKQVNWND